MGALLSRLPDLQRSLQLTEGQLGLTLIAMSIGALFGLTFSSPLIEKYGARTTAFVTVFGASAMYAIVPWVPSAAAADPGVLHRRHVRGGAGDQRQPRDRPGMRRNSAIAS